MREPREGLRTWKEGETSETQVVSRIYDGYSASELNLGCRSLIAKTFWWAVIQWLGIYGSER